MLAHQFDGGGPSQSHLRAAGPSPRFGRRSAEVKRSAVTGPRDVPAPAPEGNRLRPATPRPHSRRLTLTNPWAPHQTTRRINNLPATEMSVPPTPFVEDLLHRAGWLGGSPTNRRHRHLDRPHRAHLHHETCGQPVLPPVGATHRGAGHLRPQRPPDTNRGLMMPTRKRTRAEERAYRIALERQHNAARIARKQLLLAASPETTNRRRSNGLGAC